MHLNPACDQSFGRYVFGIDEVGLGPLAGPLLVVCCAIDTHNAPELPIKDSKKMTEKQREKIFIEILRHKNQGIYWGCAFVSAPDLDHWGIPASLNMAVHKAFQRCHTPFTPDHILVDGNRQYQLAYPSSSIIKGDSLHYTIALASVIAKVLRDRWMAILHQAYPEFGFAQHKGYGTAKHLAQLQSLTPTPHHRYSYAPLKGMTR